MVYQFEIKQKCIIIIIFCVGVLSFSGRVITLGFPSVLSLVRCSSSSCQLLVSASAVVECVVDVEQSARGKRRSQMDVREAPVE